MKEDLYDDLYEEKEEKIDFHALLFRYVIRWPWFVASVIICLAGAWLHLRQTTPVYNISASVIIKDDKKGGNSGGNLAALEGLGLVNSVSNIDNEIEILRSKTLVKHVVSELNLYTTYSVKGSFNEVELYKSSPVLVGLTPQEADRLPGPAVFELTLSPGNRLDVKATVGETSYKDSLSPFGIRMVDRLTGKPVHLDISDLPMKNGTITNRNKFILGPSGSGKSFFTNHMVRQYYEQGAHVLLVDTGNSYQGLCSLIHARTHGEDGIYFTYEEKDPIAFNPFYVEDGIFDIEKKESVKTLILTLWKRDDEPPTRAEEVALSNAVNLFLEKIRRDSSIKPSFNTFYEFIRDEYQDILKEKRTREKDFDVWGFLNVLEPYYRGGEYDFLLNSDKQLDLLNRRFIVFELDNIRDNKVLLPIVTIIIMETFITKMRKLKGIRKIILIEECWKALASANMSNYIRYLFKTVRKFFGEAVVVTQEVEDIISSPIVKGTIINNSDCKILLDQRKYMNKFDEIQALLGLTDKERAQILSINMANNPSRKYKEVWIGLGGTQSAVYATEVSLEEYICYTTEETEKLELMRLTERIGGNIELAIKQLAESKRNK